MPASKPQPYKLLVELPPELAERLRAAKRETGVSLSDLCRITLRKHLGRVLRSLRPD